ncbi:MAG: hypothetical protein QW279_01230 [Candidatus Jordarchaeaceae archaeon]
MKENKPNVKTEFDMKHAGKVIVEIDYKNRGVVLKVEDEYIDITGEELLFLIGTLQTTIEFFVLSSKKIVPESPEGKQTLN